MRLVFEYVWVYLGELCGGCLVLYMWICRVCVLVVGGSYLVGSFVGWCVRLIGFL